MDKQTIKFATISKNGIVQRIGKSTVEVPKTSFKGGSLKWYEDKVKIESEVKRDEKVYS